MRILNREMARAQTRECREVAGPILRTVLDHAAGVFERCSQTAPDGDENLGILMLLHHALEMLDGTEVLLDASCVVAATTPLRSAFEASLGLAYILQKDQDSNPRAMAYVVADVRRRLNWHEELDPDSETGQRFRADMGVSESTSDFPFGDRFENQERAAALREMLERDEFVSVAREYDRIATSGRGRPPWYSLFGGPPNLRMLAQHLGQLDNYLVLYRTWSSTTHATDLYRQVAACEDGTASVRVIRNPVGISTTYAFAINFAFESARMVLEHYRPGEMQRYGKWFLDYVNPGLKRIETFE